MNERLGRLPRKRWVRIIPVGGAGPPGSRGEMTGARIRAGVETPETERIEVPAPAPFELPAPEPAPGVPVQPQEVPA